MLYIMLRCSFLLIFIVLIFRMEYVRVGKVILNCYIKEYIWEIDLKKKK